MAKLLVILLVAYLAAMSIPTDAARARRPPRRAQPTPSPPPPPAMPDHYILAVQWGYTVCGGRPVCSSFNIQPEFTIHGLWPQQQPTVPIGAPFIEIDIRNIKPQLKVEWLDAEHNDDSLWRHEYKEHGIYICRHCRPYLQMGLDAYRAVKVFKLGDKVYEEFGRGSIQLVSETVLNTKLRTAIGNHDLGMVCDLTGQHPKLRELRIYLKLENNRYIVEDLPISLSPASTVRCPSGVDVTLPLA